MLLERTSQHFLRTLLDDLAAPDWLGTLRNQVACKRNSEGARLLFQPVHRTFYVALLELVCDTTGSPPVDPARIDSAGLVVRRCAVRKGADTGRPRALERLPNVYERWVQDTTGRGGHPRGLRGWVEVRPPEPEPDPDPARRPPALRSGHPEIDRRLALNRLHDEALTESVTPLFLAPPDVCAALGKTLLYGLVPVTSSELSEAPAEFEFKLEDVQTHMPQLLRSGLALQVPYAGGTLSSADVTNAERNAGSQGNGTGELESIAVPDTGQSRSPQAIVAFVAQLRQITIEFGAFDAGSAARVLYEKLNAIQLPFSKGRSRGAGEFLKEAARALLGADVTPPSAVAMPTEWPAIVPRQAEGLAHAVLAALREQMTHLVPHEGRFAGASREYSLRAFARVKPHDGCPAEPPIWSAPSEPYTIAPWYAASDAPPVTIPLPDPTERTFLALLKHKPNVSFVLPKPLFNLLQSDPRKLMAGDAAPGNGGPDVSWICGFNIPIITLCAFIVLNIFLQLFNLIFWWLPFVKICIPLPKRSPLS